MVREAINATEPGYNAHGELREVLEDIAAERGEINRKRLGRWINRHAGRIVNGRRFTSLNGSSSSKRWQVESVSSVCEVSAPANDKSVTSADDYRRASDGE
jgi:hypothetical protein